MRCGATIQDPLLWSPRCVSSSRGGRRRAVGASRAPPGAARRSPQSTRRRWRRAPAQASLRGASALRRPRAPRTRVGPPPRAGTQAPLRAREPAPLAAHKRPGTRRLSGLAVGRVAPRRGRARRTRPCPHLEGTARRSIDGAGASPPPPRSRTNWTRLVPLPVLTGHVSSL